MVDDGVELGISCEQTGHTEPTTSSILEPASPQPGACEDFGCQIGGMLADPRPRPRKHLSSVPVIDLLEPIGSSGPQELRVRHLSEIASHTLYLTPPRKMFHACRSLRGATGPADRLRCYSAIASPEPPNSSGKSLSLGRPSFMGRTVDS